MSFIKLEAVGKIYQSGEMIVPALKDVSLEIDEASFVSFIGPSGSGKSTLLNLLGCLDQPSTGSLLINGTIINQLNQLERANFRGQNIGFIFQNFNLLPVLSVFENVEYPLFMVQDVAKEERNKRVLNVLEKVGMLDQKNKYPNQLSGGQKQRVAVARALVTSPKVVLADEPTANLDSATALQIIKVLHQMRDEFGTTFIFATHDPKIVNEAEVIYSLEDGIIQNRQVVDKGQR